MAKLGSLLCPSVKHSAMAYVLNIVVFHVSHEKWTAHIESLVAYLGSSSHTHGK